MVMELYNRKPANSPSSALRLKYPTRYAVTAAPKDVANSSVIPSRMSVVWRWRWTEELAAEVVITATRLVPMAWRMGIPKCNARMGESRMPPPMPVMAPSKPAKKPSSTRRTLNMPRLGHHPRSGCRLGLLVRVIAGAHQRSGLDVAEAEAQRLLPQLAEFLRRVEPGYGQVVARGAEILTHGKNVNAAATEVAEHLNQFFRGFAESHHHSALRHHAGRELLGIFQQREAAFVTGSGAHRAVKTRHGFGVVIENVGPRLEHNLQRFFESLKVRNQHLDAAIRNQLANLANGLGENSGATDVVIVTIHAGHNGVLQTQRGHSFSHAARFVPVDRLGPALRHGAESAAPGADVTQQHESRGLVIPALADVGALGRLADGVQPQPARQLLEVVKVLSNRRFGSEPVGFWHPQRRPQVDLNQLRTSCHRFDSTSSAWFQAVGAASAAARLTKSDALIRRQNCSKPARGCCQRRSSTVSNTGTSSRKVASVRNNSASFHPENSDSESGRALRIEGCHCRQSLGMSSRCGYWENARAAAFCPHPGKPGKPSALSPTTAR